MNLENKQQSLLTFRVGSILCCAPSLYVKSIITPPKFTKPPGSNKAHPGIFKHGSHIVKVIDLRQKFGVAENAETGNLIIIIFNNESFAFWVDQIIDVFDFPSAGWSGLPAGIPKDIFTRTLILNKNIHLYTEFEKLINMSELSYFKNNAQQKKQTDKENTALKKENKEIKNIVDKNNNKKTNITSNNIETNTANKLREKVLSSHAEKNIIKKPIAKVESFREKHINEQKTLEKNIKTDKKENKTTIKPTLAVTLKQEPSKATNHIVKNTESLKDESSNSTLLIFLTIFILISVATLYYLYPSDTVSIIKEKSEAVTLDIIEDTEPYEEPLNSFRDISETKIIKTQIIEPEIVQPVVTPEIVENKPQPKVEKIIEKKETIEPHHAEIKKTENKVIISVYTPQTVKKKLKPLIVHVVIKGDTLWAITKKYINDPFRYPELAALNKIKNPHRIYPGDQVQIRFIQK